MILDDEKYYDLRVEDSCSFIIKINNLNLPKYIILEAFYDRVKDERNIFFTYDEDHWENYVSGNVYSAFFWGTCDKADRTSHIEEFVTFLGERFGLGDVYVSLSEYKFIFRKKR